MSLHSIVLNPALPTSSFNINSLFPLSLYLSFSPSLSHFHYFHSLSQLKKGKGVGVAWRAWEGQRRTNMNRWTLQSHCKTKPMTLTGLIKVRLKQTLLLPYSSNHTVSSHLTPSLTRSDCLYRPIKPSRSLSLFTPSTSPHSLSSRLSSYHPISPSSINFLFYHTPVLSVPSPLISPHHPPSSFPTTS